jgi:hypothetical protein
LLFRFSLQQSKQKSKKMGAAASIVDDPILKKGDAAFPFLSSKIETKIQKKWVPQLQS